MADEVKAPATTSTEGQAAPQQVQFQVDMTGMASAYTNWYRVTGTPEELILDFGLNTAIMPNQAETINLSHRIVMNFFTAKRLLLALNNVVQAHENSFGALEIDFQKRIRGGTGGGGRPTLGGK